MNHRRPRILTLGVALLMVAAAGCSSDPPTEEEARRTRVEGRLSQTFSDVEVRCIIGRLDDATLLALDAETDLDPADDEMALYTEVLAACVTDPTGTTSTSAVLDEDGPPVSEDPVDDEPVDPETGDEPPDPDPDGSGDDDEVPPVDEGDGTDEAPEPDAEA